MIYPKKINDYKKTELKLGIKSSLPKVKPLLSLIYVLWKINDEKAELYYSQEAADNKIALKDELKEQIKEYFSAELEETDLDENKFNNILDYNNLVRSQIEHLIVGLELIWKIVIIDFENDKLADSAEREGGDRYKKVLRFTKVIDQLDLLISLKEQDFKKVLFTWLTEEKLQYDASFEKKLIKAFTHLSEETVYRVQINDDDDIKFFQSGIYTQLINGETNVNITGEVEPKGPLRVLRNILSQNLNFYIKRQDNEAIVNDGVDIEELKQYTERINNYLPLTNITIDVLDQDPQRENSDIQKLDTIDKPYNRIIYGAPGTGKSHLLNIDKEQFGENFERVTFHPNYSYAQFVGSYKPIPIYKEHGKSERYSRTPYSVEDVININDEEYEELYPIINEPSVTYEYIAGPFLRILTKALKYEEENYLLIIEEINRSNVAAVFGDMFQILDRDDDGFSDYSISIPYEMEMYLRMNGIDIDHLYLPNNLYIWATMNSADQGVFPLDTAFKRRWEFEYIDINSGDEWLDNKLVQNG